MTTYFDECPYCGRTIHSTDIETPEDFAAWQKRATEGHMGECNIEEAPHA